MKDSGVLRWLLLVGVTLGSTLSRAGPACGDWPHWQAFRQDAISADGRVIDYSTPGLYTVSEGQAYAMFFALVANDQDAFDRLLSWTENNLAAGDLSMHLPAWQWGKRGDASWGVIDSNPASDADLWMAYSLAEASRLWGVRRYRVLSKVMANRIWREETADLPEIGRTLLPAPSGFVVTPESWRLNPSYLPIQVFRRFAATEARWSELIRSSMAVITKSAPKGYVPDWVLYQGGQFTQDPVSQGLGSYNAIRVYLWAGMLSQDDPLRADLLQALSPMSRMLAVRHLPPREIDSRSGDLSGDGPTGFSAALLPFLMAQQQSGAVNEQLMRVHAAPVEVGHRGYYDEVLTLWGTGFLENRYHFDVNGRLRVSWEKSCLLPALPH